MKSENSCACKNKPKEKKRNERELTALKTRLNRIIGQLNGIKKMLDENRYCGDVLIQISAAKKGLEKVAEIILKTHMRTCVHDELLKGDGQIIDETIELMERLK